MSLAYLQHLNQQQYEAVTAPLGPVLVLAGAGSGKTRVLTNRIEYLVKEHNVAPHSILAITFTNKAANEMKERLLNSDCRADMMRISTIHSFCAYILRLQADKIGYNSNFTIYDETDKLSFIKKLAKKVRPNEDVDANELLNIVSVGKEGVSCLTDHDSQFYIQYVKGMKDNNAMDFDDLLVNAHKLLCENSDVLEIFANHYQHICIDEFQDTNKIQYEIFKMLAHKHQNLFVVGDDDQSIYSWRGANVGNMFDFERDFPNAKKYILEENYRSTKKILQVANKIISRNLQRHEKQLFTQNKHGDDVKTFEAYNEQDEAHYVIQQIVDLQYTDNLSYKDCAILMRVNALSRNFEQECLRYGIPYRVVGGFKFFERKEVKDVLAYLRLIVNPYDNEAFNRAILFPKRGIGQATIDKVLALSQDYGIPAIRVIEDERNLDILGTSSKKKLGAFSLLFKDLQKLSESLSLPDFIKNLLDILDVRAEFSNAEDEDRLLNVDELQQSVVDFCQESPQATLGDYLQMASLSQDRGEKTENAVTISTIHGVKGLEFKAVFVVGLEDGLFPSSRAFTLNEIQEERRLMYVATTRARQRLFLTRAQSRFYFGNRNQTKQSSFYKEAYALIHPNARQNTFGTTSGGYGSSNFAYKQNFEKDDFGVKYGYGAKVSTFAQPSSQPKPILNLAVGQRVNHPTFGEGMVMMINGDIAEVVFASVGKKRLNVKFAPLTLLK